MHVNSRSHRRAEWQPRVMPTRATDAATTDACGGGGACSVRSRCGLQQQRRACLSWTSLDGVDGGNSVKIIAELRPHRTWSDRYSRVLSSQNAGILRVSWRLGPLAPTVRGRCGRRMDVTQTARLATRTRWQSRMQETLCDLHAHHRPTCRLTCPNHHINHNHLTSPKSMDSRGVEATTLFAFFESRMTRVYD